MSEYLLKRKRKIYKVNPHKNNLCKSLITRRDTVSQCKSLIEGSVWLFDRSTELENDRLEKYKNGRRYVHCAFAASIFKAQRLRQY